MKNYVIYTEQGYVKYAQITDNEGHVAVWKALYTSNLKYKYIPKKVTRKIKPTGKHS